MLNDKEVIILKDDKLKFKEYVETLNEIVLTSESPLAIGIYGEWGSGKTSLMKLTQNSFKNEDSIKTLWFDAWKYDKVEDLRVALIFSIIKHIESDQKISSNIKTKAFDLLKKINWLNLAKNVSKLSVSLATPYLAGILSQSQHEEKISLKHDVANLLSDDILNTFTLNSLNFIHEFEELYKSLIKKYVGKDGTLIVFIDDLDRCLPDKVLDILEAIKLFLSVPGTIFFIGIDREIVIKGIELKYSENKYSNKDWASNYLDKIIQLPFRLPPLRTDTITTNFINSLHGVSYSMRTYAQIIAEVGGNPRTIKRVINNFELQTILCKKRALRINEAIIAKLIVLEFRWPNFYNDFLSLFNNSNINLIQDIFDNTNNKKLTITSKYINDLELLGFLTREPSLNNEIKDLDKYIHLARDNNQTFSDFDQLLTSGKANFEKANFEIAIENLSDAIILDEAKIETYYFRSLSYLKLNDIDNSLKDIQKCESFFLFDPSTLEQYIKILIENCYYSHASFYNNKLLEINSFSKQAINNAFELSKFNQKNPITIDTLCDFILEKEFDQNIFNFILDISSPTVINEKIIEVYKLSIPIVKENYKLIQDCVAFYIKKNDLVSSGNIFLIEGKSRLIQHENSYAFKSLREAIRISNQNQLIINQANSLVSDFLLSFEYIKFLFQNITSDFNLVLLIKKALNYKLNTLQNEFWDTDFLLGEVELYIDDLEEKQELYELLELIEKKIKNIS